MAEIGFLSTYPPRECGIATFTYDLTRALGEVGGINCRMIALSDRHYDYGSEVLFHINQQAHIEYIEAPAKIATSDIEVLMVEHEYGIFGGEWGEYLLDLIAGVNIPVAATLHTVLPEPNPMQRRILAELCARADAVVLMSEGSRNMLCEIYGVDRRKTHVIHHGVPRADLPDRDYLKEQEGLSGRTVVSTFGMLSPGKGLEYGIEAISRVAENHPNIYYLILGQTHPVVAREKGEAYRESLEGLVDMLGLKNHIGFVNRYLSQEEIMRYLKLSDIYMTPYLGRDQAVSGTLAYAVGSGRVIVSTPYPYAKEMLAEGRGLLGEFADAASLAGCLDVLLGNSDRRMAMEAEVMKLGQTMGWQQVAAQYADLLAALAGGQ